MLTYNGISATGLLGSGLGARRHQWIEIPSFHIGGWYDGYRDSLPRMLEHAAGAG